MIDFLLICFLKAFRQLLRVLPEKACTYIGAGMGSIAFLCLGKRRHVAVANARRIMADRAPGDARAVARSCFRKLGINFIESLLFQFVPRKEYGARFKLEKRGRVDEALNGGRGVLALGFHYSNWEITGLSSILLGREIVALARPLKGHARLNDFLNGLRGSTGLTIIPNRDTARDVARLLAEDRIVAFLGDQREKRSRAVWVDLFGQKVPTSKGVVAVAMKTGVPVVPVYARREGFLRYTIVYNEPLLIERHGAPLDELIVRNARRVNAFLEEIVRERPDEWFLAHRRFGRDT